MPQPSTVRAVGAFIPESTAAVTADWVDAVLHEGGAIGVATRVTAIDLEPIGVGVGLLGELARVRPAYEGSPGPDTVIVKLRSPHEANHQQGMAFGFYDREQRFYREIAPSTSLRVPVCYWQASAPDDERFCLVLEDFSHLEMGDQVAGISPEQARRAVEHLARFQAGWWETGDLDDLEWMPYSNGPVTMLAVPLYQGSWPAFIERFESRLPEGSRELGERVGAAFEQLLHDGAARPHTIIHSDFRLDNLFFGEPGTDEEVGVIDWQLSTRGRGAFDVAYLLCQSMSIAERRKTELDILRAWYDIVTAGGRAEGYTFDEALYDYKRSALVCLVYPVASGAGFDLGNERGLALVEAMAQRTFTAALDLDAAALLPD